MRKINRVIAQLIAEPRELSKRKADAGVDLAAWRESGNLERYF